MKAAQAAGDLAAANRHVLSDRPIPGSDLPQNERVRGISPSGRARFQRVVLSECREKGGDSSRNAVDDADGHDGNHHDGKRQAFVDAKRFTDG